MAVSKAEEAGVDVPDIQAQQQHDTDGVPEKSNDFISPDAQIGVQGIEATTIVWTKWHIGAAYTIIWLIYFVASTQEVVVRLLNPFVTSAFALHSLTPAVNIISSVIAGVSKIPLAKILDTWGRPQGLALMGLIWTLGFIMMASCANVETYCAAQVFSLVGAQGVSYCLTIFVADTTSLLNRPLMLAFATSPYIVTTWLGGPINDALISGPGWRWGFGAFAIVTPVVVVPLVILFLYNHRRARRIGILPASTSSIRNLTFAKVGRYCLEVDLVGIFLLAGGMALFLLPFSLYSYQTQRWASPLVISMLVIGGLMIIGFVVYEKFFAPIKFIPMHLLADRTVFFGGLMFFFIFFSASVWGAFFNSMLLVAFNQGVTKTTYISNIYRVGSCFAALFTGYFMRRTGRFKWVAMYYGLPLMILGVGLMIHFRRPDVDIGYVVMTQIFVAFAGGPIVVAGEMAMMAPLDHQYVAVIIAILDLFGSMGTAVGLAVPSAIWTSVFPPALRAHLPPGADVDRIYSSIYTQLGYKMGTEIRAGINLAYGDAQRYMLITSTCILVCAWACVAMWRDIKVTDLRQTKGNVV